VGSELLLHEVVVVEVVLRQVHTIVGIGIFPPTRVMIGTALGTCQRTARNVFSADWTQLRWPGSEAFLIGHYPVLSKFGISSSKAGAGFAHGEPGDPAVRIRHDPCAGR
jgi:hypothetical protein